MDLKITVSVKGAQEELALRAMALVTSLGRELESAERKAKVSFDTPGPETAHVSEPEPEPETEKPKRKRAAKKKTEPAENGSTASPAEPEEVPEEVTAKSEPAAMSLDDVRQFAVRMRDEHGAEVLRTVLDKFGKDKVTQLDPEQYEPFTQALKEAVA